MAHPELALASGAIKGWDARNQYYHQMLVTVAQHYGFDLNQPYDQLPESAQRVILHGSGETEIPFTYTNERGRKMVRRHPFEGVIPSLERRLRETDSLVVRDELAKLRSQRACPACEGSRLRREARNVFIGEGEQQRGIWQISAAPLAEASRYFESLAVHGIEEGDRVQDRQGDRFAAALPGQRRPGLPVAGPLRRHALGRRVAAHPPRLTDRLRPDRSDVRARRTFDRTAPA